jgi:hypothetical protein
VDERSSCTQPDVTGTPFELAAVLSLFDLLCQQAFTGSIIEHDDNVSTIEPSVASSLAKV